MTQLFYLDKYKECGADLQKINLFLDVTGILTIAVLIIALLRQMLVIFVWEKRKALVSDFILFLLLFYGFIMAIGHLKVDIATCEPKTQCAWVICWRFGIFAFLGTTFLIPMAIHQRFGINLAGYGEVEEHQSIAKKLKVMPIIIFFTAIALTYLMDCLLMKMHYVKSLIFYSIVLFVFCFNFYLCNNIHCRCFNCNYNNNVNMNTNARITSLRRRLQVLFLCLQFYPFLMLFHFIPEAMKQLFNFVTHGEFEPMINIQIVTYVAEGAFPMIMAIICAILFSTPISQSHHTNRDHDNNRQSQSVQAPASATQNDPQNASTTTTTHVQLATTNVNSNNTENTMDILSNLPTNSYSSQPTVLGQHPYIVGKGSRDTCLPHDPRIDE